MTEEVVDCRYCCHYYITYDKHFPYGCRAFRFKTRNKPCIEVKLSSGEDCLHFTKK
ncbi:MAG: uracil-DNA glycosylase [Sporomusaceae bacterium]|nr:uracil-DNA glycosylase [Sporomusaceae bacterium]